MHSRRDWQYPRTSLQYPVGESGRSRAERRPISSKSNCGTELSARNDPIELVIAACERDPLGRSGFDADRGVVWPC